MIHTAPHLSAEELRKLLQEFDRLFAGVCAAVPQPNSFDLIGTEKSPWKPLVNEKGVITLESQYVPPGSEPDPLRDVRRTLLTLFDSDAAGFGKFVKPLSHDCLEGWLPVSRVRFATERFPEAELLALVDEEDALQLRINGDDETFFCRIPLPCSQDPAELLRMEPPVPVRMPDGSSFEAALKTLKDHWKNKFAAVLDWDFPHTFLKNGILAALAKTFITQYDGALRYGATRYYCDEGRCAESFPPTVLTACEGAFFYGLEQEAFHFLGHFIGSFVSDGTICHRGNGASLSEHGMLLALFAQAKRRTADETFFREYGPAVRQVALRLCRLTEEAAPELVSCPTCGRTSWNLIEMAGRVERFIAEVKSSGKKIALRKVAVMGCAVNGPGEAADADIGIAGGNQAGELLVFKFGKPVSRLPQEEAFAWLKQEILNAAK